MDTIPELGSKLSIVTKDNIRWEGVFATLNSNVSTLSLTDGKLLCLIMSLLLR